jgi:glycerophosphoryl diester phosphodiesterase
MKKKQLVMFFCTLFSISLCFSDPTTYRDNLPSVSATRWFDVHRPAVVAHRGCWQGTAEISLRALANCERLGVEAAEGDIRAAKDGVLVWIHDTTLDRTTDQTGRVADKNYSEIKTAKLRVGNGGADAPLTDQTVPRLSDVLRATSKPVLMLDVKEGNYDAVYEEVKAAHAAKRVVFIAYVGPPVIRAARFLHKSAFMPVPVQCDPGQPAVNCYTAEDFTSGRAFDVWKDLRPLAYFSGSKDDIATTVASVGKSKGIRFAAAFPGEVEGKTQPELVAIWAKELHENVSVLVSYRPVELAEKLNSKGTPLGCIEP